MKQWVVYGSMFSSTKLKGKNSVTFSVITLAAGLGTRMKSLRPKVLHELAGKPILHHVLDTVRELSPQQTVVVYGHQGEELQSLTKDYEVDWQWQEQQLGTGHALRCAYSALATTGRVLLLYGDVPLITTASLQQLLYATPVEAVGVLTTVMQEPGDLGRIVRDDHGNVTAIVETRDASNAQLDIKEINSGIYVFPYKNLADWLPRLQPNNDQQELYATDLIAMAVSDGVPVLAQNVADYTEVLGVNTQQQLSYLERAYQYQQAICLMRDGVKIYDPKRIDIRGDLNVGKDVVIDINAIFEGEVHLGDGVIIGPNVHLKNVHIAAGSVVHANSVIEDSILSDNTKVGPFARIRPGTKLANGAKIGNFVEVKNSVIGKGTKINHLSYIGDSDVGNSVNIGAGVITCNFDGAKKHKTIIKDEAFIGSNCELVAPVTIGEEATLGAGTTLTRDAPPRALTLSKKILTSIACWVRPTKQKEGI